mmetsp:Transcript_13425/g.32346  ORF Transcript_13425/g.32346 Transcript_13425/m.32346 type:complete len:183 (-) Transcript_13425:2430-2978(-)
MSDFENVLATKLDHHGLTSEQSQTYLNLGVTPFIVVRLTMDNYYDLLMRLRQYTLNCEGGWDQWKVHLEHHSKKLGLICQLSPSRTNCLLNTYIYLQDQEKSSFMSSGLQSKINKDCNPRTTRPYTSNRREYHRRSKARRDSRNPDETQLQSLPFQLTLRRKGEVSLQRCIWHQGSDSSQGG